MLVESLKNIGERKSKCLYLPKHFVATNNKMEKTVLQFTDDECVLLASIAIKHFEISKSKRQRIQHLSQPRQAQILRMLDKEDEAYNVLLKNANDMFNEKDPAKAMSFGFIHIEVFAYGLLKGEKEEQSIREKMDAYLSTIPKWNVFMAYTQADKIAEEYSQ